ncbi:MAG: tetratricopeptide repeat protein [Acidobacteriaceae bacterium]|nr:tetratricopeptide repeat protein [Acidobacteriaceae bacterium]
MAIQLQLGTRGIAQMYTTLAVCLVGLSMLTGAAPGINAQMLTKDDLHHEIARYEAAVSNAQSSTGSPVELGRLRVYLATLYEDAGLYDQSEKMFDGAIRSFKRSPMSSLDLAAAIDGLGTVYLDTGRLPDAERAELNALAIRESAGQKPELARSWLHLSTLYLRQRSAAKAKQYGVLAANEILSESNAFPEDKISALFALSLALGLSHEYTAAIDYSQNALDLLRQNFRPDDFPVGFGTFLLGYAQWKAGNLAAAGELMRQGSFVMGRQLGWWSPGYRSVMAQYARFLRQTKEIQSAKSIERELQRAVTASKEAGNSRRARDTIDIAAFF